MEVINIKTQALPVILALLISLLLRGCAFICTILNPIRCMSSHPRSRKADNRVYSSFAAAVRIKMARSIKCKASSVWNENKRHEGNRNCHFKSSSDYEMAAASCAENATRSKDAPFNSETKGEQMSAVKSTAFRLTETIRNRNMNCASVTAADGRTIRLIYSTGICSSVLVHVKFLRIRRFSAMSQTGVCFSISNNVYGAMTYIIHSPEAFRCLVQR
jgi:hypothetical protein